MNVLYFNNIASPYMVDRFNSLTLSKGVKLSVLFNHRTEYDRSWNIDDGEWMFDYHIVHERGGLNALFQAIREVDVVVSLYAEPIFIFAWLFAKFRRKRTAFWVEVTFDSWVKRYWWKELIKRFLFRRVDGVVTVGEDGKRYAMRYGVPESRVHFAPHTVDSVFFSSAAKQLEANRDVIRSRIGVTGTTFVYCGRLWSGKGLDWLLESFEALQRDSEERVSLLMIGDGVDEQRYKTRSAELGLHNVVFTGFVHKEDLPQYYVAGDVFVFPTLGDPYGLVVDEAMACGLPVIASSATGEAARRIWPVKTGVIVPVNDRAALTAAMRDAVDSPAKYREMGAHAQALIRTRTPETWAKDFASCVDSIMASERVGWWP